MQLISFFSWPSGFRFLAVFCPLSASFWFSPELVLCPTLPMVSLELSYSCSPFSSSSTDSCELLSQESSKQSFWPFFFKINQGLSRVCVVYHETVFAWKRKFIKMYHLSLVLMPFHILSSPLRYYRLVVNSCPVSREAFHPISSLVYCFDHARLCAFFVWNFTNGSSLQPNSQP